MSRLKTTLSALAFAMCLSAAPAQAASSSVAAILEAARAQASELEAVRKVLNGPDQNMRIAAFKGMVTSGDDVLRRVAHETGLASADSIIRAMAFKAILLSLNELHLTLAVDASLSKKMQEAAAAHIAEHGNRYVIRIDNKNFEEGSFGDKNYGGQVNGLVFHFSHHNWNQHVTMQLRDDNTLAGVIKTREGQFLATGRLQ
jgi:hypothetical protein